MHVGLEHYLVVSALLFCLGLLGVVLRRNLLDEHLSKLRTAYGHKRDLMLEAIRTHWPRRSYCWTSWSR